MTHTLRLFRRWTFSVATVACALPGIASAQAKAAAPSADQALKLAPIQKDVEYDIPAAADAVKCTIKAEKIDGRTGWVVRGGTGEVLREFVDTNNDNVVDRWSYFKNGIEIYRDIDENHNGKADQYRWLNTAGIRWGIDRDEDGKIDAWRQISAEEVSAEVVLALRDKDPARFTRLLLTPAEIKAMGMSDARTKQLTDKAAAAPAAFNEILRRARGFNGTSTFVHFGGSRPGMIPAGAEGVTKDIIAYENVMAMFETDGKDGQLPIGTIVKVGDTWKLIDVPVLADAGAKTTDGGGFFFNAPYRGPEGVNPEAATDGPSENVQKMMDELIKLDEAVARAQSEAQQISLNDRRSELLLSVAAEVPEKDRPQWIRQYADTISAAAQTGTYPPGVEKLAALYEKLDKNPDDAALVPYVKFRYMTADYGAKLQKRDTDFVKVQAQWLEDLQKFVTDFPKASDSAEALLQLGIAEEFAGQEEKAKKWYGELISNFDTSPSANKARGALNRLNCVGKSIDLRGKNTLGQAEDLAKYKGKTVLVHYWATWCEPCKTDMAQLKELYARYGKSGFTLIGVNLDNGTAEMNDYLTKNRLPWSQLYEPGGLDSRLANEMGILTLPTMLLIDDKGKVVNRNIHITELENELKSRLK